MILNMLQCFDLLSKFIVFVDYMFFFCFFSNIMSNNNVRTFLGLGLGLGLGLRFIWFSAGILWSAAGKIFLGMVLCRTIMVRCRKFKELWSTAGIKVECRNYGFPLEVL